MNVDNAWKALTHVNDAVRFADLKAGAVLAACGVLGGLLVKQVPRLADFSDHPVHAGLLCCAIVLVGSSALVALRALRPRLRTGEARSLVYFDHVARRYADERSAFVDNFTDLMGDDERFARDLVEQIWANSVIARRKFVHVATAISLLGAAMAVSGAAVIVQRAGAS